MGNSKEVGGGIAYRPEPVKQLRPLTKRTKDGKPYERSQEVEAQILSCLQLPPELIVEQAQLRDYRAAGFLSEECLIYLIREYHRQNAEEIVWSLLDILFRRCSRFIENKLQSLESPLAEEAYDEVIEDLLGEVLDLESNRGDFMQVRFWVVLKRITISAYGRYISQQSFVKKTVPLSLTGEYGFDDENDSPHDGTMERDMPDQSPSPEDFAMYQEVLNAIEEPYRTAFVLQRLHGWPIESNDPDEPTISRYFGKTPRTIRNWLASVDEKLQPLRAEKG